MYTSFNSHTVYCSLLLSLLTTAHAAHVTLSCVPYGGSTVVPGDDVEVECFVTASVSQTFGGSQLDLACSLPRVSPGSGSVDSVAVTIDPDNDGMIEGSRAGIPFLFGPPFGGPGTWGGNPSNCRFVGSPCLGPSTCQPTLLPGQTAYLGTIIYHVSDCANGNFEIVLENFSDPPSSSDTTKLFGLAGISLIPFNFTPVQLAITGQACCFPDGGCSVMDSACCVDQGGEPGTNGMFCDGDPDGDGVDAACGDACPGDPLDDSDGDGVCDSADLCPGEDDTIDANSDQVPDCLQRIPTNSAWALVVLTLVLATGSKIMYSVHHRGIAAAEP